MTSSISEALRSIGLLAKLAPSSLDQLSSFSSFRQVRKGETIFCQGEPSPYCFGVLSGEVIIQRVTKDRRFPTKVLSTLGPGSLFGESALFEDNARAAMASANADGEVVAVLGAKFRQWIAQNPEIGLGLLAGLLQSSLERLHQTSHELSIVYGAERILAAERPFSERVNLALEFLKSSIAGLEEGLVYWRSPYWEEYEPFQFAAEQGNHPAISLAGPLMGMLAGASGAVRLDSAEQRRALEEAELPWPETRSVAAVPLIDPDQAEHKLQGALFLVGGDGAEPFSPSILLMLSALSSPLTEAIARYFRQEDAAAQRRLSQSRRTFSL